MKSCPISWLVKDLKGGGGETEFLSRQIPLAACFLHSVSIFCIRCINREHSSDECRCYDRQLGISKRYVIPPNLVAILNSGVSSLLPLHNAVIILTAIPFPQFRTIAGILGTEGNNSYLFSENSLLACNVDECMLTLPSANCSSQC